MAKRAPSAAEQRHISRVADKRCLVCGGRSTVHHVTGFADRMGRVSRRHDRVVPLCPRHHQIQHGPHESVEALSHQGFFDMHGIDLMAEAERLWLESIEWEQGQ